MKKYLCIRGISLLLLLVLLFSCASCVNNSTPTEPKSTQRLTVETVEAIYSEQQRADFARSLTDIFARLIYIQEGITNIGDYAFTSFQIQQITIPEYVISIGKYVFSDCNFITQVVLHDQITSIGEGIFSGCTALKDVYFDNTETVWETIKPDAEYWQDITLD